MQTGILNPILANKLTRALWRKRMSSLGPVRTITMFVMDQEGFTEDQARAIAWTEIRNEPICLPKHMRIEWHIKRMLSGEIGEPVKSRPVSASDLQKRLSLLRF